MRPTGPGGPARPQPRPAPRPGGGPGTPGETPTMDAPDPTLPARYVAPAGGVAWEPAHAEGPGAGQAQAVGTALSLRTILRGIARHWWQILALWAVGSVVAVALIQARVKPQYQGVSILRVEPNARALFNNPSGGETFDQFLKTQLNLITSPNVLSAAAASPAVAGLARMRAAADPEAELAKSVIPRIRPETYLIEVGMVSNDAVEPAIIVNAVVDAYLDTVLEWADSTTRKHITNLESYHRTLVNEIAEKKQTILALAARGVDLPPAREALQAMAEAGAVAAPKPTERSITLEGYRALRMRLNEIDMQLAGARAELAPRRSSARAAPPSPQEMARRVESLLKDELATNPEILLAQSKLDGFRADVENKRRVARNPNDPAIGFALNKIKPAEATLASVRSKLEPALRRKAEAEVARQAAPELPQEDEKAARVASLEAQRAAFAKQISELEVSNREAGKDQTEAELIRGDLVVLMEMSGNIRMKLDQLKFDQKDEARISQIVKARPSGVAFTNNRSKYLMMAPLGILGAVLLLFGLLEVAARRVADPTELSARVHLEVYSLPPLPPPAPDVELDERTAAMPGPSRAARERANRVAEFIQSVDHLRVAVCGESAAETGRVIMITSACGGEGKTTLAAQLASRCAAAGMSTLLIDADLRRGSLGRLLEVPEGPGLIEVLGGEVAAEDALVVVPAGGFHILTAGQTGVDPGRLLQGQYIAPLLARLRQTFDVIIIDTPPVLPVPDALAIGRHVDGAVIAARHDASRFPLVEQAHRRLTNANIKLVGLVVNGVKQTSMAYGAYAYTGNAYGRN